MFLECMNWGGKKAEMLIAPTLATIKIQMKYKIIVHFSPAEHWVCRTIKQPVVKEKQAFSQDTEHKYWSSIAGHTERPQLPYNEVKKNSGKSFSQFQSLFFPTAYETLMKEDFFPGHKTNLNKFKGTEVIPSMFSDHNVIKLEINNGNYLRNPPNILKLNYSCVKKEVRREIRCLKWNGNNISKFVGDYILRMFSSNVYITQYNVMCVYAQLLQSCPTLCDPWSIACWAPLSMGFSRKNTEVDCHTFLQWIFPTQGSNPRLLYLLHYRWIIYLLSHRRNP